MRLKLSEILKVIDNESKNGFVNVDDWRWPDVDHLITMGFDFADDYRFKTKTDPKITIYKKKEKVTEDGKEQDCEYFYVEDEGKKTRRFKDFNEVIDYFDSYSQPELDKNK